MVHAGITSAMNSADDADDADDDDGGDKLTLKMTTLATDAAIAVYRQPMSASCRKSARGINGVLPSEARRVDSGLSFWGRAGHILSVFPALIVYSELKSVHPGFPVAFIF